MVSSAPLIEIVIPNWNGCDMLAHCLLSLRKQTYQNFSITVVDNGSVDDSVGLVEEEFPEINLIKFDHNTGFSVAVNAGIEQSDMPWVLLLNNDMEVAPDCLEHLHLAIKKYQGYDFFALKMMSYHHRDIIDGAGDAVFRGGVGYRLGTLEQDSDYFTIDRETFGACGGAALYSRDFFARVGLFDPDFFAYLEDVDLNMRARRFGLRCMYLGSARVYHIGSATSGSKINKFTISLSTKNNINVLVKNYSTGMWLRFLPAIVIYQCAWFLFCLKKSMVLAYLDGLYEAVKTLPLFYRKRRNILINYGGIGQKQFADMIKSAEKEAVFSIMARRTAAGKSNFMLNVYNRLFL